MKGWLSGQPASPEGDRRLPTEPVMQILAGQGNPGAKYAGNRHNFGFMVIDRIAAFSASGRKVRLIVRAVEVTAGPTGVASARTACHIRSWSVRASAMKYGRTGPRTVLKPAHPIENAFSMICSRQHEEDKRPATDQRPVRTKRLSYKGYHAFEPELANGLCDKITTATIPMVAAIAN